MRPLGALLVLAALVGCGGGEKPTAAATATATATPEGRFAVAYKVAIHVVRRLDEGRADKLIREEGEVIARSDFDLITSTILADWLSKRGIEVEDPGVLTPTYRSVYKKQGIYLMIVSADPAVADALDELHPKKRRLAAFYNHWGGETDRVPQAGDAMLDWLRVFKLAVRAGGEGHVIIIPDVAT
jgi:hypothetical protein